MITASVCISTYGKAPAYLARVLTSIVHQYIPFHYELVIVDDGNEPPERIRQQCRAIHPSTRVIRIDRPPGFRNSCFGKNVALHAARGEVIVMQDDDVEHQGNAIAGLVSILKPGNFVIAELINTDFHGILRPYRHTGGYFAGPKLHCNTIIFGALYRHDAYAVGGFDERFLMRGGEDGHFVDCLRYGLNLTPIYTDQVRGHHLHHEHRIAESRPSVRLRRKIRSDCIHGRAPWCAIGGPWLYEATT